MFVEAARRIREGLLSSEELVGRSGDSVLANARQLGIEHRAQADPLTELRDWDAFALPSRSDPCPIAMLEAMALGLPVIGSRIDGIPELVAPGSGILVPAEDPDALAREILALARSSEEERRAMGAAARRRVRDAFTLERQAEGLHRAYLEVASQGA